MVLQQGKHQDGPGQQPFPLSQEVVPSFSMDFQVWMFFEAQSLGKSGRRRSGGEGM